MEKDYQQLRQEVDDLANKLEAFLSIYYRSDYPDKYVFTKKVVLNNQNLDTEGNNGMKIGNSSSKLSVYGETPVVQASAISAPTGQANDLDSEARTAINLIRTALTNFGITA